MHRNAKLAALFLALALAAPPVQATVSGRVANPAISPDSITLRPAAPYAKMRIAEAEAGEDDGGSAGDLLRRKKRKQPGFQTRFFGG